MSAYTLGTLTSVGKLTVRRVDGPTCGECGKTKHEDGSLRLTLAGGEGLDIEGPIAVALWDALDAAARACAARWSEL